MLTQLFFDELFDAISTSLPAQHMVKVYLTCYRHLCQTYRYLDHEFQLAAFVFICVSVTHYGKTQHKAPKMKIEMLYLKGAVHDSN